MDSIETEKKEDFKIDNNIVNRSTIILILDNFIEFGYNPSIDSTKGAI
jgi:hypothetical protein